jgi:hypothetical protein
VLLWVLTGCAIWVMMHIWLPNSLPNILGRFIGILFAGFVGAVVGGAHGYALDAGGNPMPCILGSITVGQIFSGGSSLFGGAGGKPARSVKRPSEEEN